MYYFSLGAIFLLQVTLASAGEEPAEHMALYEITGSSFKIVREDLELAITERGMVINNVSHIGNMLARTRAAVDGEKQVFVQAEALEFCSSVISRKMMEASPHNIVFCPYILYVYVLPGQPEKVFLAYRHPQAVGTRESQEALQKVEDLLKGIVADVVD